MPLAFWQQRFRAIEMCQLHDTFLYIYKFNISKYHVCLVFPINFPHLICIQKKLNWMLFFNKDIF